MSIQQELINKIHNTECLEFMKNLPDNSIDLVLTDPPYGVRKEEEWDNKDLFINTIDEWLNNCLRISKNGVIWFCANRMIPYILRNRENIFHRLLIWDKPAGSQYSGASNNNLWYSIEPILVFKKGNLLTKKGKLTKYEYSVFKARNHKFDDFKHPTSKPYLLIQYLINHYSDKNDLIFDPFMGSGTTAVACKQLGRNFIGCEINKDYCDIANKRLQQENLLNFEKLNKGLIKDDNI